MAYSNVKPYLNLKRSTAKLYREAPRFLADVMGLESQFEKPYRDTDSHRAVQQGYPGPTWPQVRVPNIRKPEWFPGPWTPRSPYQGPCCPDVPDDGGLDDATCNYCIIVCNDPPFQECEDPVECHTGVWCSYAPHDWTGGYWTVEASEGTVIQMMSNQQVNPGGTYYLDPVSGERVEGIGSVAGSRWRIFPDIQVWVDPDSDASLTICFHDPLGNVCCQDVEVECCSCDTTVNPFTIDDASTPDTIAPGGSISVYVLGGCSPYDWSVAGTGYSFTNARTEAKVNTLNAVAEGGGCGVDYDAVATITVTDSCGNNATSALENDKIRSTGGQWIQKSAGVCVMSGVPTDHHVGGDWFEKIVGNKRQYQTVVKIGTCNDTCVACGGDAGLCECANCCNDGGAGCTGAACEPCISYWSDWGGYLVPYIQYAGPKCNNYKGSLIYYEWEC